MATEKSTKIKKRLPLTDEPEQSKATPKSKFHVRGGSGFTKTANSFYATNSGVGVGASVMDASQQGVYSPIFSKDFLELPQTLRDKHLFFRYFYARDPLVGRAIDVHAELPMSKIRLTLPQGIDPKLNEEVLYFYEKMVDHIQLFSRLLEISHEYWLLGNCVKKGTLVSTESGSIPIEQLQPGMKVWTHKKRFKSIKEVMVRPYMGLMYKFVFDRFTLEVTEEHPLLCLRDNVDTWVEAKDIQAGDLIKVNEALDKNDTYVRVYDIGTYNVLEQVFNLSVEEDQSFIANSVVTHNCFVFAEFDDNLKMWDRLVILDPDTLVVKTYPFSTNVSVELVPTPDVMQLIRTYSDDPNEKEALEFIPEDIRNHLMEGKNLPLDTDPYSGSHVAHIARSKSPYETMGISILERCLTSLIHLDKLRQAQAQIASRHMTPIRIIRAPQELNGGDMDDLRSQVDQAMLDPDYSIIVNYPLEWEEVGSNGRLLELSSEFDFMENRLMAGLGLTKEILTGEGTYSGSRINLEIMNNMYLVYREKIRNFVHNNLFKPIAKANNFWGQDKFGNKILLYPEVSFTRLSIRDNQEIYENLFNLYQKGSLNVGLIYELLNLDEHEVEKALIADTGTVKDASLNEAIKQAYSSMGDKLVNETNLFDKVAKNLRLEKREPPQEEGEGGGGMEELA